MIDTSTLRRIFERRINSTKIAKFPLGPMIVNGVFQRYMDSDTDSAWIGFAIGYRQAERQMIAAGIAPSAGKACITCSDGQQHVLDIPVSLTLEQLRDLYVNHKEVAGNTITIASVELAG